jgi:hypothetical protein
MLGGRHSSEVLFTSPWSARLGESWLRRADGNRFSEAEWVLPLVPMYREALGPPSILSYPYLRLFIRGEATECEADLPVSVAEAVNTLIFDATSSVRFDSKMTRRKDITHVRCTSYFCGVFYNSQYVPNQPSFLMLQLYLCSV